MDNRHGAKQPHRIVLDGARMGTIYWHCDRGGCIAGIFPVENSHAGAFKQVGRPDHCDEVDLEPAALVAAQAAAMQPASQRERESDGSMGGLVAALLMLAGALVTLGYIYAIKYGAQSWHWLWQSLSK